MNYYYDILRFLILLSILTLTTFFYRRHSAPKTPTPQSYPLIGNLIGFLRNRHRFHDWLTDMLSATPSLTLKVHGLLHRPHRIYTADPKTLSHILRSNFPNYTKGTHYTSVMQDFLGTGMLNSSGTYWFSQRKMVMPIFISETVKAFTSDTFRLEVANFLIPGLSGVEDSLVDLQKVLRKFCFDNVCKVVFGINLSVSNSRENMYLLFLQAFYDAHKHISTRFMSTEPTVWKVKRFFNIGNERDYKKSIANVNTYVMDVIRWRETQPRDESRGDLLSGLMNTSWDMGFEEEERREFLRDMVVNFLYAGKDTISTALTWFFWLLAGHPHCKHMIHKELSILLKSSGQTSPLNLTTVDLKTLNYLRAALAESMRLFPPVPINSRQAVQDDILPDGTYVGAGWSVYYSTYAMGRMEKIWGSDCREFKPERWLDGNGVYEPSLALAFQYKYAVFNCGIRVCLGESMAYLNMLVVAVGVLHEFEMEVVGGGGTPERLANPPCRLGLVLSMRNGLLVRIKKRQQRKDTRGLVFSLLGLFLVGLSFYKRTQNKNKCVKNIL